ncbi:conserved hypothetical protein [[Clostridium] ultunense Esp]|nr:conserved hypothetical protein [[Clostridium] ultunense Esp]
MAHDRDVHIIISTSFPLPFIRASLHGEEKGRLAFRRVRNDLGFILQKDSIEVDMAGMNEAYDRYMEGIPAYLDQERRFLTDHKVDLVLTDISPFPFVVAKDLHIPTVGISNFTWYTAYQGIIPDEKLQGMRQAYQKMDFFLPLAGAKEPDWGRERMTPFPYFCRSVRPGEVARLRRELNPDGKKKVVYFGLGMKIDQVDLGNLPLWESEETIFVVSSNTQVDHPHVIRIPDGYTETQHYIAASDLVISKAGWGTVAEAVQTRRPLLLDRPHMMEDQNTIRHLTSLNRAMVITEEELKHLMIDTEIMEKGRNQVLNIDPIPPSEEVIDGMVREMMIVV